MPGRLSDFPIGKTWPCRHRGSARRLINLSSSVWGKERDFQWQSNVHVLSQIEAKPSLDSNDFAWFVNLIVFSDRPDVFPSPRAAAISPQPDEFDIRFTNQELHIEFRLRSKHSNVTARLSTGLTEASVYFWPHMGHISAKMLTFTVQPFTHFCCLTASRFLNQALGFLAAIFVDLSHIVSITILLIDCVFISKCLKKERKKKGQMFTIFWYPKCPFRARTGHLQRKR